MYIVQLAYIININNGLEVPKMWLIEPYDLECMDMY